MKKMMLDLNKFQINKIKQNSNDQLQIDKISSQDIAIIGMAGKLPKAVNLSEFWRNLAFGVDCVDVFPKERKEDVYKFSSVMGISKEDIQFNDGAYLDEIDKFDPLFFNINPKEASLMDPNQRLFLETAWHAIEDAGYGGQKISGSKTGVYVGFSNDFDIDYKYIVQKLEPKYANLSLTGNIRSIIASRIAYLLDLKGPSMLIDTACSSGLTAVHLACLDLQGGRCEMAIVGGGKLHLAFMNRTEDEIGIMSPNFRAKTFDDSADGTGSGEGVIALLLKPLEKALADNDQIYAVIKGTAVNQDGSSIGITAPNSLAQAEVLESAWQGANIDPETITYIETHGTGTSLGDPIEIDGITRAFEKYTAKKQFCAVSSVKTNLGHLDHAAGIVGLVKAVLALKNKELPPNLHFESPNQKIKFMDSPVYVVDRLKKWQVDGAPLRCGVSAFGLSGTNCHVILEEAPRRNSKIRSEEMDPYVLLLSAKNKDVLIELIKKYEDYLDGESVKKGDINLQGICYTANTGRTHYSYRLALIFETKEELIKKLEDSRQLLLASEKLDKEEIYYGEHRIVSVRKENKIMGELTDNESCEMSNQANLKVKEYIQNADDQTILLKEICQLYINGAEIEWEELYKDQDYQKVSLPVYPFLRKRCWVTDQELIMEKKEQEFYHPLLHYCLAESFNQDVYETKFSIQNHWVLEEHLVNDKYVLPGTTYLEMARVLGEKYYQDCSLEFIDVIFISPLAVDEDEIKVIQTVIKKQRGYLEFVVTSKVESEERWIQHAEGKIYPKDEIHTTYYDLNELIERSNQEIIVNYDEEESGAVVTGPRWENLKKIYLGIDELLAELKLPAEFEEDLREYELHPALLDIAVNVAIQAVGEGLYLPLSYKKIELLKPMPANFYSYMHKKENGTASMETFTFDISLIDLNGEVFAQITDYTIKKVHQGDLKFNVLKDQGNIYYELGWRNQEIVNKEQQLMKEKVLIFKDEKGISKELAHKLRMSGFEIIEVEMGQEYHKIDKGRYVIEGNEKDYDKLLVELKDADLSQILHLSSIRQNTKSAELSENQKRGVDSLFYLVKSLLKNKYKNLEIVLISEYANEVTKLEKMINPDSGCLFGLGKVVSQEYSNLVCRAIDIDDDPQIDQIILELNSINTPYMVAYRNQKRFVEEFKQVKLQNQPYKEIEFKKDGVYLITGGTGGIGLEIGKYFASKDQVNIALINRSKLPSVEMWDEIVNTHDDHKLVNIIKSIREMEAKGANVYLYNADISKIEEIKPVLYQLRKKFGRINGVIHGAGVAGDGFLIKKEKDVFNEVLAPKVKGTRLLDQLTIEDAPDFFVMFSSITSVFGAPGQGDYMAANTYLDSYASYRHKLGNRTLTINWPVWKETGMAVDYDVNNDGIIFKAIPTSLAINAFDEILRRDLTNVIIGELNYREIVELTDQFPILISEELKENLNKKRTKSKKDLTLSANKKISDVIIKGSKMDGYSPTEMKIAQIWGSVLGLEEVDVYSNFYELGGDSIFATYLAKEMEQEYSGLIDITDIFTYPSIHQIAEYIDKKQIPKDEESINNDLPKNEEEIKDIMERLASGEINLEEVDDFMK